MSKTRRNHGSAFKAKVALEALKGEQTVAEIAAKHGLHPTLVTEWKRQLAEGASAIFEKGTGKAEKDGAAASFTSKSASRKWNWIFWHASAEPGGEASDDRPTEQAPVVNPAMPAGAQSLVAVLSAGNRQYGRPGADGADRPPVPGDAVLRLAQDWLRREGHVVNRKRG